MKLGSRAIFTVFVVMILLGSAAALLIGSNSIQPPHLLLAFVALTVLLGGEDTASALNATRFPEPGFWLICLVIYGLITGFLIPRFLAGDMQIAPLGVSEYGDTGSTVPLGPVSSNFTQGVYLSADLICFLITIALASSYAGFITIASAILAYAVGNVAFAVIDLITYSSGLQWLLEPIRNAQYTLHNEEQVNGLKRIVGSFPEASAFARSTLGVLGFTGTLWLCNRRPALTGALALASLLLVVLSTSSSGLAGTLPVLLLLYATAVMRLGVQPQRPYSSAAILCAPLLIGAVTVAVLLDDRMSALLANHLDIVIFNKSDTSSAIQRGSWNTFAMQNFFDTYGVGVGLGTVRTSSFPVALLSNVGVPGTIFYLLFAVTAFRLGRGKVHTFVSDGRLAARNACFALIIGDLFLAPTVEQGLLFFVLAGLACAKPDSDFSNRENAFLDQSVRVQTQSQ